MPAVLSPLTTPLGLGGCRKGSGMPAAGLKGAGEDAVEE